MIWIQNIPVAKSTAQDSKVPRECIAVPAVREPHLCRSHAQLQHHLPIRADNCTALARDLLILCRAFLPFPVPCKRS